LRRGHGDKARNEVTRTEPAKTTRTEPAERENGDRPHRGEEKWNLQRRTTELPEENRDRACK